MPQAGRTTHPTHQVRECVTPQDRSKRKFDVSTPTDSGALRIRLDTRRLDLERNILGQVARSYEGINALAVLMWERHPCAVKCATSALPCPASEASKQDWAVT